jgi:hypothetical protein
MLSTVVSIHLRASAQSDRDPKQKQLHGCLEIQARTDSENPKRGHGFVSLVTRKLIT